jgi:hypothetical protein
MALWKFQHYTSEQILANAGAADSAKSGADGTANLLRYAWGLDTTVASFPHTPTAAVIGQQLYLHFVRIISATDISYTVEASGDLATWSSGPTVTEIVSVSPLGNGVELVTVRDKTLLAGGANRRFLRLRVERVNTDTDADGLPDDWEVAYFGDLTRTGAEDWNNDGLLDRDAFRFGLNPKGGDESEVAGKSDVFNYDARGWLDGITLTGGTARTLALDNEGNIEASN